MGGTRQPSTFERMGSLLVYSAVTTLAIACKVTPCDAFAVRSTTLRFAQTTSGVGFTMKDSVPTTGESLEDLRKVQKANGGVVGDARYGDGETLLQVVSHVGTIMFSDPQQLVLACAARRRQDTHLSVSLKKQHCTTSPRSSLFKERRMQILSFVHAGCV